MAAAWRPPLALASSCRDGLPPADTLVGPEDVAVLLQAGLASAIRGAPSSSTSECCWTTCWPGRPATCGRCWSSWRAQLVRPRRGAERAAQLEQDCLRRPLDLTSELSARLGLELPRLSDYVAGGRYANLSYFEALDRAAAQVLTSANPTWPALPLQLDRAQPRSGYQPTPATAELERRAREAIAAADKAGRAGGKAGQKKVRAAYEKAFAACGALLAANPEALELPWLKEFWSRNHEAWCAVVVRNVQQWVDDVGRWLAARLDARSPRTSKRCWTR